MFKFYYYLRIVKKKLKEKIYKEGNFFYQIFKWIIRFYKYGIVQSNELFYYNICDKYEICKFVRKDVLVNKLYWGKVYLVKEKIRLLFYFLY